MEPIQSAQNAKLKAVRALRAGKERTATVLEGRHLLQEALDAEAEVSWVLVEEGTDLDHALLQRAAAAGAEVVPCRTDLLHEVSRLDSPPDLLAWVKRPGGDWQAALAASEPGQWWLVAAGAQESR